MKIFKQSSVFFPLATVVLSLNLFASENPSGHGAGSSSSASDAIQAQTVEREEGSQAQFEKIFEEFAANIRSREVDLRKLAEDSQKDDDEVASGALTKIGELEKEFQSMLSKHKWDTPTLLEMQKNVVHMATLGGSLEALIAAQAIAGEVDLKEASHHFHDLLSANRTRQDTSLRDDVAAQTQLHLFIDAHKSDFQSTELPLQAQLLKDEISKYYLGMGVRSRDRHGVSSSEMLVLGAKMQDDRAKQTAQSIVAEGKANPKSQSAGGRFWKDRVPAVWDKLKNDPKSFFRGTPTHVPNHYKTAESVLDYFKS